ncbi:MAG TPA: hypothetical protein VJ548_01410 [Azospira sp.]|nr:hypothetical protein [Azospira sp.]
MSATTNNTAIILLPGAYIKPEQFRSAGFEQALAAAGHDATLLLPALELEQLTAADALTALQQEVIAPARATYRRLWLGGISLGGFFALAHAADQWNHGSPGSQVDGLCLLAPYPGSRITAAAIDAAGGLEYWQPTSEELADPEFRVWHWLRTPPAGLPLFYGYGREDRFAPGMAKLAAALPRDSIHTRPGGHDWPVWSALWADFLAGPWLA